MRNKQISVIIATKNEEANLPRLLESLKKQTDHNFETVIVDNFSSDKTYRIAQKYTNQVYKYGKERSQQRNFGARKAVGKYFLFLDADMELPPPLLQALSTISQRSTRHLAVIIPETVPAHSFFSHIKKFEKKLYEHEPLIEAPRFFEKNAFLKAGGYNEDLIAGEDWDLRNKIEKYSTITRVDNYLFHYEDSFLRELIHKIYYSTRMRKYAQLHHHMYTQQSGAARLRIFWKKRNLFFRQPLQGMGLIITKAIEYVLYKSLQYTQ